MTETEEKRSSLRVIVHSFFVVPFLIAAFAVLVFGLFRLITYDGRDAFDLLTQIRTGSHSQRWQAAVDLSKLIQNPNLVPTGDKFVREIILAYQEAKHDDPRVQQYLTLSMGRAGRSEFVPLLISDLSLARGDNQITLIHALGLLGDERALLPLMELAEDPNARIRLEAIISLGNIGNEQATPILEKALYDSEPNVRWDAAIALAKMGNNSGRQILINLLDREYLLKYKEVDAKERTEAILIAIQVAAYLDDDELNDILKHLSNNDPDLRIRDEAQKALRL
ncbi:MAG: HEAT repeat domain-containing protein [Fidelibacterota bacterium]